MKVWVDLRSPAEVRTFAQAISSHFIVCIRMSAIFCQSTPELIIRQHDNHTYHIIVLKIHEDEGLNSKIYEGFQKYQFDKSSKNFVADSATAAEGEMKKRYFVSLMSESLIKKGVFFRLRKRVRVSSIYFSSVNNSVRCTVLYRIGPCQIKGQTALSILILI